MMLAASYANACGYSYSMAAHSTAARMIAMPAPVLTALHSRGQSSQPQIPAPDFSLTDANGFRVKLSDDRGKVVLLNFWATWCGPCKIEIPWFIEFENIYKNRGFAVLGVSMDDDGWRAVKPFLREKAVNYRVVLGDRPSQRCTAVWNPSQLRFSSTARAGSPLNMLAWRARALTRVRFSGC
jgi:thiol-disulfide isomerase/thioredoxin